MTKYWKCSHQAGRKKRERSYVPFDGEEKVNRSLVKRTEKKL